MTNATGSNNLMGLLGGLVEAVDTVLGMAEEKLSKFAEEEQETDQTEGNGADPVAYKLVAELGLSDALVLDDAEWAVRGVEFDDFDDDIVHVLLDNGETYSLIRTSLVRVV